MYVTHFYTKEQSEQLRALGLIPIAGSKNVLGKCSPSMAAYLESLYQAHLKQSKKKGGDD